jgi:hypothetical protein
LAHSIVYIAGQGKGRRRKFLILDFAFSDDFDPNAFRIKPLYESEEVMNHHNVIHRRFEKHHLEATKYGRNGKIQSAYARLSTPLLGKYIFVKGYGSLYAQTLSSAFAERNEILI